MFYPNRFDKYILSDAIIRKGFIFFVKLLVLIIKALLPKVYNIPLDYTIIQIFIQLLFTFNTNF